jgi:diadenosine tetraphosphate (Ap4A) HIT family hydrolase
MTSDAFALDPRLAKDTVAVCDWPLCRVLLMNDARYPWIVLVPQRANAVEAFDLSETEQAQLWREATHAAELLKTATGCRKTNIGALGNMVAQLHVHVIARNEGDAAWPGPVWGVGAAEPYETGALGVQVECMKALLHAPAPLSGR